MNNSTISLFHNTENVISLNLVLTTCCYIYVTFSLSGDFAGKKRSDGPIADRFFRP